MQNYTDKVADQISANVAHRIDEKARSGGPQKSIGVILTPAVVGLIMEILRGLLTGCMEENASSRDVVGHAKSRTRRSKFAVRRATRLAIKEEHRGSRHRKRDTDEMADEIVLPSIADVKDDELVGAVDEAAADNNAFNMFVE